MLTKIVSNLLPENTQDNQLIKDVLAVFTDYLEENSDIAINIRNILDEEKTELYDAFISMYLQNIQKLFQNPGHNEIIYRKLTKIYEALGKDITDYNLGTDINSFLTRDYLATSKAFKSAKGTKKSIEYIYNMIIDTGIQGNLSEYDSNFKFTEGTEVFQFDVEGSLIPEVYEQYVKPLAHPIGWAYIYKQLLTASFTDIFNVDFDYTFTDLEVRCKFGVNYWVDDYKNNLSADGSTLVIDNTVVYVDTVVSAGLKTTTVYFESGEYLINKTGSEVSTILYGADREILKNYDELGNCALYINYSYISTSSTQDELLFGQERHWLTSQPSNMNSSGAKNMFCGNFYPGNVHNHVAYNISYVAEVGNVTGLGVVGDFAISGLSGFIATDYFDIEII